jgi:hypothetical protein
MPRPAWIRHLPAWCETIRPGRLALALLALPATAAPAWAEVEATMPDLTGVPLSWLVVLALIVAYGVVVWAEKHELNKSIPVLIGVAP